MNGRLKVVFPLGLLVFLALLQPLHLQAQRETPVRANLARTLMDNTRTSTLYVSAEGLPRFSYAHSVVVNNTTRPVKLNRISATGKGLQDATREVLAQLDATLREHGASRSDIVQLDVFFVGDSFDHTLEVSSVLDSYFAQRTAYNIGAGQPHPNARYVDFPVRAMLGVRRLDGNAQVAIVPTILDPQTSEVEALVNPNRRARGARRVLIGGITAQQPNFLLTGYGDYKVQTQAALRNFEQVLNTVGVDRGSVRSVTAYHLRDVDPAGLRSILESYFGRRTKIDLQAVDVACLEGVTTLLNAEAELR